MTSAISMITEQINDDDDDDDYLSVFSNRAQAYAHAQNQT